MTSKLHFFPVGNGDMTLIKVEDGTTILIDCNIRKKADDENDETFDAATALKDLLESDEDGRPFVDVMVLSHPDEDHCKGLTTHFHLGDPDGYDEDSEKIIIGEMWSSPIIFRRQEDRDELCEDALAWEKEAKRRVKLFRDEGLQATLGQDIVILGEDIDGKTDDLGDIVRPVGEEIAQVRGEEVGLVARIIGPIPDDEVGEDEEEKLSKNDSSVILNFSIEADGESDAVKFLTGGDAGVEVWEQVWERERDDPETLAYDILQAPHHASWRSLSHESWSETNGEAEISDDAYSALSQARANAVVVSSSKPVKNDDSDPPCQGAKDAYLDISNVKEFKCTGEHPKEGEPDTLTIEITGDGWDIESKSVKSAAIFGGTSIASKPRGHG